MARVATAYVEVRPDLTGFGTALKAELARFNPTKKIDIEANTSTLGNAVKKETAKISKKAKIEVKVDYDKTALSRISKAFRHFGDESRVGIVGRLFGTTFSAIAGLMESVAKTGGQAFEKLGKSMMDAGGALGPLGEGMVKLGAGIAGNAASMGNLIGILVGLGAVASVSVIIVGALSTAMAAVLAIVIPLVAAVTALIAEFIALGAAISASLLVLPGAIAGATAAFGPLVAVMDKLQALFQKTAKAVGPLYEVTERLRNAIFAVISSDFVKTFQRFATQVLPKLFVGIDKVAQAWNKFFLTLFKLAEVPGFIDNVNKALAAGASLVNLMAEAVATLAPPLLEFAAAALPALKAIGSDILIMVRYIASWLSEMTKGPGAVNLFAQIAGHIHSVMELFKAILPLAGTFMSIAIGPATQFVDIVTQIVTALNDMFSTVGGTMALHNFFVSMNTIVAQLGQLFIDIVPSIMEFGDMIREAMVAARPLTEAFLNVMMSLLRNALPGVIRFMQIMANALSDPGVMIAIEELGTSIGQLFSVLGDTNAVMAFVQALSLIVDLATGLIWLINKLASATSVLLAAYKIATGNISGAVSDMAAVVNRKSDEVGAKSVALGTTWQNLSKSGNTSFDNLASGVTSFANANAWQTIIDNANAASAAIGTMGRNAFEAAQLQDEKKLGRAWRAQQSQAKAKKASKPKIDTGSLSKDWMAGWNTAVDTSIKTASASTSKAWKKFITNIKPTLKALNVMDFVKAPKSYDTGKEIAAYLAKGITSGAKNIKKATDIIYKANKANLDKLASTVKDFASDTKKYAGAIPDFQAKLKKMTTVGQLNDYLAGWHTYWKNMLDEIVEFKANVVQALTPRKNLTGIFGYFPTPAEVKARLDLMYTQMKKFSDGIANLQKLGLDPGLAREWLQAGIEGAGNLVQGLQGASKDQIKAINDSYTKIGTEADKIAESQAVTWKGVGQSTVEGYIKGIEEMQGEVAKTMTKMLTDALAAAKKSLGIKSPSTVFADIGVNTMLGYVEGINSMASETLGTVSDMYGAVAAVDPATLTPQMVKPSLAHTGTLGAVAANAQPEVNVRVYIGDRELTDMVRVVLENADSTRARALYAGRRGG